MGNELLTRIVKDPELHKKWLNTLSYLENCGARKIAACEHPTKVKSEMLKHACEEFRHAFYLKQQIKKVGGELLKDYSEQSLLGGLYTKNYLDRLEVGICRFLKTLGWNMSQIKERSYICVTYAIEVRAAQIYPCYQNILKENGSSISVRMLILEEDQHLAEMEREIEQFQDANALKNELISIENSINNQWISLLTSLTSF